MSSTCVHQGTRHSDKEGRSPRPYCHPDKRGRQRDPGSIANDYAAVTVLLLLSFRRREHQYTVATAP